MKARHFSTGVAVLSGWLWRKRGPKVPTPCVGGRGDGRSCHAYPGAEEPLPYRCLSHNQTALQVSSRIKEGFDPLRVLNPGRMCGVAMQTNCSPTTAHQTSPLQCGSASVRPLGFCTATCPTYTLLGDELDSPRGRIYQIKICWSAIFRRRRRRSSIWTAVSPVSLA